jgi:cell division protein ZipA
MMNFLYHFAQRHPILTIVGLVFFVIFGIAIWWFFKRWKADYNSTVVDKTLYENQYFDEAEKKSEEIINETLPDIVEENIEEKVRIIEPIEEIVEEEIPVEKIQQEEVVETPKKTNLIVAFYIRAFNSKGFNGADIFAAMEQVGLKYGERQIFHYYGSEQLSVSTPIFSVANLLEPGNFNAEKIKEFNTPGLACFMCLPTALSGRVAFELMLHCAKRLADLLKGKLEEEHQQTISAEYIDFMRYNIERFEYQTQQE